MQKFRQNLESIKLAYNIGVFSKKYARNKFARLYAETFGVASGIYNSMDFSGGGVKPFCYLCDWLEEHGIIVE